MKRTSKIITTIVVVVLFIAFFAIITEIRRESGHNTSGIIGLIVLAGFIGALRAIWKNPKR